MFQCVHVCVCCLHIPFWSPCVCSEGQKAVTHWWGPWLRQTHWNSQRERVERERKRREGEEEKKAGQRCHGDDLLSATASHSSCLQGLALKWERKIEDRLMVKKRVSELSLLPWIWPLSKSAIFGLSHVRLFATWRFDFLLWAAGLGPQAHSSPTELTNLSAERIQPVFTASTWVKQLGASLTRQEIKQKKKKNLGLIKDIHNYNAKFSHIILQSQQMFLN